jgi:hypothetical protein
MGCLCRILASIKGGRSPQRAAQNIQETGSVRHLLTLRPNRCERRRADQRTIVRRLPLVPRAGPK